MVSSAKRTRSAIAAASLALVATVATATFAQATETDDPRANTFPGNASTCADAGLAGEKVAFWDPDEGQDTEAIEFTGGTPDSDTALTITKADGLDVTGIVVKGGDGYNVYEPGERGLEADPPWENLVAPLKNGELPEISHWFVCAEEPETPPSSTEPPTTTTEPPSSTTTEPPSSTTEPPSSSEPPSTTTTDGSTPPESSEPGETSSPVSTTTAAAVDAEESDDDLALTGFGAGWMIPIGALLIIGGGAALWLARARRA